MLVSSTATGPSVAQVPVCMCAGYFSPLFVPFSEMLMPTSDAVRDSVTSPVMPELFFGVSCMAAGAAGTGAGVTGAGAGAGIAAGSAVSSLALSVGWQAATASAKTKHDAAATLNERFILTSALDFWTAHAHA